MHKMIAIIQFKVEGQTIMNHPSSSDHRLMLDTLIWMREQLLRKPIKDTNLPTIDPADPQAKP